MQKKERRPSGKSRTVFVSEAGRRVDVGDFRVSSHLLDDKLFPKIFRALTANSPYFISPFVYTEDIVIIKVYTDKDIISRSPLWQSFVFGNNLFMSICIPNVGFFSIA